MTKDLIIGGASNYTWDDLKYWVNSIRKSGFTGDVAIVGTNMKKDTIDRLTQEGVILSLYGTKDAEGNIIAPSNNAPHVERFFYIWNFLENNPNYYNVITTDTRDVIFQSNPSEWLDNNLIGHSMVASSEGMKYKNEPWGNDNLLQTFGPFFHNHLKEGFIFNVGTIAGDLPTVKSLMLLIFQLSINRPIPVVDQAVYNFILRLHPWIADTYLANNSDNWAIQLGTTIDAVRAGKGDLGALYMRKASDYESLYEDNQPKYNLEMNVVNLDGERYCIVHQWDRVPFLKMTIEKKYGE